MTDPKIRIRVLGIDPGSRFTGYGIVDMQANQLVYIDSGTIKVTGKNLGEKLGQIFRELQALIEQFQPDESAIEKVFMHRNADSAIKLGQARGVAIATCAVGGMCLYEYTANQIKQATVGRGHAAKEQVQHMVKILLCLPDTPQQDEADALAAAICHSYTQIGTSRFQSGLPKHLQVKK